MKKLTYMQIKNAKIKEQSYTLIDSENLSIKINPNGKKHFIKNGIDIGTFGDMTLKQAREFTVEELEPEINIDQVIDVVCCIHKNLASLSNIVFLLIQRLNISADDLIKIAEKSKKH